MYLVSLIEKAQLGAIHYGGVGISSADANRLSGKVVTPSPVHEGLSAGHAPPIHSVAIDDRWLDAVTRYSHFTCTVDDVARVAMAFSELAHVRWTLPAWHGSSTPLGHGIDEAHSGATGSPSLSIPHETVSPVRGKSAPSGGRLRGRLYLTASHVISVEEAEEHLRQALQRKGTAAAQRAWLELVHHHTAYAAYVDSTEGVSTSSPGGNGAGEVAPGSKSCDGATGTLGHLLDSSTGEKNTACEVSDDQLLEQLSTELRASLSAPMLRALLFQMRRDAAHTEKRDQRRTAERQLNERVTSAYEQVRALLGGKQANGRNAWSLLVAMREESRFDDALDAAALLSRLLRIPASGLTATMLREAEVRVEPPSATWVGKAKKAKGKGVRSKRRREADEADAALLLHVTQTTLESVTDLQGLSEEQLRLVRVQLDRTTGSVRGVMEVIAQQHA
ncbi:conserved hypothetical protein [Leishmania mexicana MHOM/GT/2001/U1103]|uniref:Uncharacterized protein n=1 Tax=Leishmania mexicana (strain MHOM/GT/2001/U1103) TaxID=929439 RepID=E9AU15_LEIMU|nr:conserved hypothetical protein [Leishmania mexicana MHOM/GT/2001/U1103]CBZ26440.1 conserved hypothetical protein [Leishmania mexicana MHOM/GT/2001/U1103]